jgi:putative DNA primase/helicase
MPSAGEFIEHLLENAPPDQFFEFRRIKKKGGASAYATIAEVRKNFPSYLAKVLTYNKVGWNIYFGTCPRTVKRGGKKCGRDNDVKVAVCLWVDTDDKSHDRKWVDDAVEALNKLGLEPSCVIESGYGRHFYWMLEKPVPIEDARWAMVGIHQYLQGDNVYNPSRIMRLPGSMNVKDQKNPKPCHVSEATWKKYPIEAFDDIKEDPASMGKVDDEQVDSAEKINREAPKDIKGLLGGVGEGDRNNAAAKLAGHYFGKRLSSQEVFDALSTWNERNTPPMDEKELKTVISSIAKREGAKKKKGRKRKDRGDAEEYFEGDEFLPAVLAAEICTKEKLIATPIGDDGIGNRIHCYRKGCFADGGASIVETSARQALGRMGKATRHEQVIKLIRGMQKIEYDQIDREAREWVNVQNGMLNWKTGELKPHDPKYLSTIQVGAEYDPEAKSEELDKFLEAIFEADALDLVEEFVGYLLIPDTSLQKCFVAVGAGGNGKGTFLKVLSSFLGESNVSALSIHEICEDQFGIANLFGKLANIHHDLEPKLLEKTGKFKNIVSGDELTGEEKYKTHFKFKPFCRLLFSANQFPRTTDRTQAFYDRLIFVPFPNRFRGTANCILDYDEQLIRTPGLLPSFLNRALRGLRRVMERGRFTIPQSSLAVIEEYRRENSSSYDFVREFCTFDDPTGFISRREMYQKYVGWCDESGLKSMSSKQFKKSLADLNVREMRRSDGRGWSGISWMNGTPKTEKDEIDSLNKELEF